MEDRILDGKLAIAKYIYAVGGTCDSIDCLKNPKYNGVACPVFETLEPGELCDSEKSSLAALDFINSTGEQAVNGDGGALEVKILEYLVKKEGVCYGLPCQLCPLFDSCECESRVEILSAASLALAERKSSGETRYRTVKWISEKSGKVLTGLLVAVVLGRAIVVSKKDASIVVSIDLEKLIQ